MQRERMGERIWMHGDARGMHWDAWGAHEDAWKGCELRASGAKCGKLGDGAQWEHERHKGGRGRGAKHDEDSVDWQPMDCSYVNLRNMACSWGVIEASTLQNMSASRDPSSMPRPYSVWRRRRAGHKGRRTTDTADTAVMPRFLTRVGEVWGVKCESKKGVMGCGVCEVR